MYHIMQNTSTQKIIHLAQQQGIIRSSDLKDHGIPRMALKRLYDNGTLLRSGRGMYLLADAEISQHISLAEVCKRVPHGNICLLSALRFHEIGTQAPHEIWMAIHPKARKPNLDYPPLHIVRFSGPAMSEGLETHSNEQGEVRVYSPAKTVVDCFRYRNRIGLDVALEAMREALRGRRVTVDELWGYAKLLRISTVIRPYLEAIA